MNSKGLLAKEANYCQDESRNIWSQYSQRIALFLMNTSVATEMAYCTEEMNVKSLLPRNFFTVRRKVKMHSKSLRQG